MKANIDETEADTRIKDKVVWLANSMLAEVAISLPINMPQRILWCV